MSESFDDSNATSVPPFDGASASTLLQWKKPFTPKRQSSPRTSVLISDPVQIESPPQDRPQPENDNPPDDISAEAPQSSNDEANPVNQQLPGYRSTSSKSSSPELMIYQPPYAPQTPWYGAKDTIAREITVKYLVVFCILFLIMIGLGFGSYMSSQCVNVVLTEKGKNGKPIVVNDCTSKEYKKRDNCIIHYNYYDWFRTKCLADGS